MLVGALLGSTDTAKVMEGAPVGHALTKGRLLGPAEGPLLCVAVSEGWLLGPTELVLSKASSINLLKKMVWWWATDLEVQTARW